MDLMHSILLQVHIYITKTLLFLRVTLTKSVISCQNIERRSGWVGRLQCLHKGVAKKNPPQKTLHESGNREKNIFSCDVTKEQRLK